VVDREESMLSGTVAGFDRVIDVNLRGSWLVMRAGGQAMVNLGRPGALVMVSSINAMRPGTVDYSTSKAGVEGLTRAAARVLGPHGIRVNTIRSGFIDTDMLRYAWDVPPGVPFPIGPSEQVNVPLGRMGQPSETAQAAIVWLCSAAASYVTGTCLDVDGGALVD
jgi:NAD(P)-dependent dehydrogenase (short-subunit alcohol dehydrogenase family)